MSSAEKEALKDALDFIDQLDIDESDAQPSTSVTHQTRKQSNSTTPQKAGTSSATGDTLIPSPFKASLFWSEKPPAKKTRRKEKVPAVTSAESYRLYLKKKEEQKAEAARLKEERKRARLAKAAEKQSIKGKKPPPKKRQKKEESDVESEETDVDGDLLEMSDAEEEPDDEVKEFEESSYIIVQFEGEYFPGIVTEKHDDGADVRLMTFAGLDWKWPQKDDDAFYPNEDIMQTINVPMLKNSRGIYEVPEIKRYRTVK